MKKIIIILTVLAACVGLEANAHAIWIQSNLKATKSVAHDVNVYYGEYPEGQADSVQKWLSDLKDLEVWLTSPTGKKTKMALKDAETHLTSSFIPDEDGVYYVSTVHTTKELGGATKYEFSSVVPVVSGKAGSALVSAPASALVISSQPKAYRTNQSIELFVQKEGEALAKGEVSVMSPEGWVKTLHTDDKGRVSFIPNLKGRYVIEASDYKKEDGEWNGKAYTHAWKGSTTSFVVN